MKFNGKLLNSLQSNFIKELMGDNYMTDVRAEAVLNKICSKYDVDSTAVLEAINKNFSAKNAELKKLEAQDLTS